MRTIIAGTRNLPVSLEDIATAVKESGFAIDRVLSGDGGNVDRMGALWAERAGLPVDHYPANWAEHGRSAGPRRNKEMARNADALILLWDGKSPGSKSVLEFATCYSLHVYEKFYRLISMTGGKLYF